MTGPLLQNKKKIAYSRTRLLPTTRKWPNCNFIFLKRIGATELDGLKLQRWENHLDVSWWPPVIFYDFLEKMPVLWWLDSGTDRCLGGAGRGNEIYFRDHRVLEWQIQDLKASFPKTLLNSEAFWEPKLLKKRKIIFYNPRNHGLEMKQEMTASEKAEVHPRAFTSPVWSQKSENSKGWNQQTRTL